MDRLAAQVRGLVGALAYIDAHAGEPITVADIATGAGVGARVLQDAFAGASGRDPDGLPDPGTPGTCAP
jgi:transcriptional regulator GlxA family with amidase domain